MHFDACQYCGLEEADCLDCLSCAICGCDCEDPREYDFSDNDFDEEVAL